MENELPGIDALRLLADYANNQLSLERQIEELEEQLKLLNAQHKQVSQTLIPKLMQEIGVAEFKLTSGAKVTVTPFYAGKITSDAGYNWLKEHGHGSIVKSFFEVAYDFTAPEEELEAIEDALKDTGLSYIEKKSVHHMTLGSFIREQTELGVAPPSDLFNVYTGYKTKIK